ncbi:MAG: hypothetical protein M3Z04_08780 [Chloroflexota bacterium]|nr:hypothetical protein [Chloroflexota bacterium]
MTDPSPAVHVCRCLTCQTAPEGSLAAHHRQINLLLSRLTEPQRRWYVASLAAPPAGPSANHLAVITGLSLPTIRCGRAELAAGLTDPPATRHRQRGGGRPCADKKIPR